MATLQDEIKIIIAELTRLQTVPWPHRDTDDDVSLPGMIGVGNGRLILVSQKIDDTIKKVADQLRADDASLSSKVTDAEWRASVRQAFGPALTMIDLYDDPDENAKTVLNEIKTVLRKHVTGFGLREFAFGCTFFGNTAIKPFSFGPVRFESRLEWLARKSADGEVTATTRRRVEQAWSGKRLGKRKPSLETWCEKSILDAIHSCPFVCSVTTSGLAAEAGHEKALTAARLATAAIALLCQPPSRALEGMNLLFDRRGHHQHTLSLTPSGIFLGYRLSHMPHGPWLKNGEWEAILEKHKDLFSVVGEILAYVIDPAGKAARPKMMNALAQALLWFHEACREIVTLMAIVKYSAALDALACGKGSSGIRRLINARLGISDVMNQF